MNVKKIIATLSVVAGAVLLGTPLRAQISVTDLTAITQAILNGLNAVDDASKNLDAVFGTMDKLDSLSRTIERIRGGDGVGGRVLTTLQKAGHIQRLTRQYNYTLKALGNMERYLDEMRANPYMSPQIIDNYTLRLRFAKIQLKEILLAVQEILRSPQFDMPAALAQLDKGVEKMQLLMAEEEQALSEVRAAQFGFEVARSISDHLDGNAELKEAYQNVPSSESVRSGVFGILRWLAGILGLLCLAWAAVLYFRGNDSSSTNVFLRVAVGLLVLMVLFSLFDKASFNRGEYVEYGNVEEVLKTK